jgi:N-acetyl-anhydromuramyl-L-alanine amidase AmpD
VADNPTRVKGLATEITPLVRLNTHVPHYRGTVARLPSRRRGIAYETESWPYVPASQYRKWTAGGRRPVRLVVIHDMEFPETARAAEVIAHDFATRTAKNPGSAHINVDNDSIVQCVKDNDIAFAAPGANRDGIQIELAGFGSQTREQWLDNYSEALLQRGADAAAQYCLKYGIPPIHITNQQLAAGAKGIIGHYQATAVYHESTHTDPGNAFPWDYFISLVGRAFERRKICD